MQLVRGILKVVALLVGGAITIVSLMALAGSHVGNGWARAGIAVVVALAVPLFRRNSSWANASAARPRPSRS